MYKVITASNHRIMYTYQTYKRTQKYIHTLIHEDNVPT